jgi:inorganic pyrophosphatase
MRIDAISIGNNPPEDVNVIIEVPIGGEPIKYEMDKAAGTLVVDRFLHTPTTAIPSTCSSPTRGRSSPER